LGRLRSLSTGKTTAWDSWVVKALREREDKIERRIKTSLSLSHTHTHARAHAHTHSQDPWRVSPSHKKDELLGAYPHKRNQQRSLTFPIFTCTLNENEEASFENSTTRGSYMKLTIHQPWGAGTPTNGHGPKLLSVLGKHRSWLEGTPPNQPTAILIQLLRHKATFLNPACKEVNNHEWESAETMSSRSRSLGISHGGVTKQSKKQDWRYGSSGRAPALQVWNSWVQTPVPQKKKQKINISV
jgi:hypothetical protein